MDKKAVTAVAIGIIANGFLVPTVLNMVNLSQGWILVTSGFSILALWKWGHQPQTSVFVMAGGTLLLALATIFYFRKPDIPPPTEATVQPGQKPVEVPIADLAYRVCGVPIMDASFRVTHFIFGVELHNPNKTAVPAFMQDNPVLVFGGVTSKLAPPDTKEIIVVPDERLTPASNVAFVKSGVDYPKPKVPGERMAGQVRFEFKFGKNRDAPDRRLVVAGALGMLFRDGGREHGLLQFTPSGDSPDYDPLPCDLKERVFGSDGREI